MLRALFFWFVVVGFDGIGVGGVEGEAGEALRGEGSELHLCVQVPDALWRGEIDRIRPHL